MEYVVFKAKKREGKEAQKTAQGNGDLFFLVGEKICSKEYPLKYRIFLYVKEDDVFKIARCYPKEFRDMEQFENNLKKEFMYLLPYSCESPWYRGSGDLFDISFVFESNNREEFLQYLRKNKIVYFEEYNATGTANIVVNNNSSVTSSEKANLIESCNVLQIKKICFDEYGYLKTILSDGEQYSYSKLIFATKDFKEWYKKHFYQENDAYYTGGIDGKHLLPTLDDGVDTCKKTFCVASVVNNSVVIKKVQVDIRYCTGTEQEKEALVFNIKDLFFYNYEIGKDIVCVKKLKKGDREVSPFDMFNINSKSIIHPDGIWLFSDSLNIYDFLMSHYSFFEKCGFINLVKGMRAKFNLHALFVLYLSLIWEYPVVELLLKIGHVSLIEDIFLKLLSSSRKDEIRMQVNELEELINNNTTKGILALRIPSYIGDYLKMKHASLDEYLFWRDIFEITGISKENFEEFLNMPERILLNSEFSEDGIGMSWFTVGLQEILKYKGYSLKKTLKYCYNLFVKECYSDYYFSFFNVITILKDTLCMAEELNFSLECYPENLQQIHNQLSSVYQKKAKELEEKVIASISEECHSVIENVFSSNAADLPTKAMEKLTYTFPASQIEFTQEGQNMHNCVAGYFNRVRRGECVIFFVRKKDNIDTSYITAEIRKTGIAQVMYSNNRPVPIDSMDYKYCRYIANKILKAIRNDEVHAINKIRFV